MTTGRFFRVPSLTLLGDPAARCVHLWGFSGLRAFRSFNDQGDRFGGRASEALAFVKAAIEEAEEEGADAVGGA
jgi:hypothetical protein